MSNATTEKARIVLSQEYKKSLRTTILFFTVGNPRTGYYIELASYSCMAVYSLWTVLAPVVGQEVGDEEAEAEALKVQLRVSSLTHSLLSLSLSLELLGLASFFKK